MEPSRKRRKLSDQVHQEEELSSTNAKGVVTTTPSRDALTLSKRTGATAAASAKGKGTTAVQDAWKEAKAQSLAQRGRRPGPISKSEQRVDVYDDIDGALPKASSKQKPAPASTPSRPRFDPLRNQKSASANTSSPLKSAVAPGFFKQFHRPKSETTSQVTPASIALEEDGFEDIMKQNDRAAVSKTALNGTSEEHEESQTTSIPAKASGKPGWSYASKPNRTFEDEIREVAEAARERAERGEEDESAATLSKERRSKIRTFTPDSTPRKGNRVVKTSSAPRSKSTPKVKEPLQKIDADHVGAAAQIEHELADAMDVDVVANGDKLQDIEMAEVELAAEPETPSKPRSANNQIKISKLKDKAFTPEQLEVIQTVIIDQLTGKRPTALRNLESEYGKVASLITQTVTAGESNSMLLIGARGSGKSALVNQILREQAKDHQDDFHVVRLNGLIHTDDRIALREIWRQLGREMEVGGDDSAPKNYADTLTTLLALLSHPAEQGREQPQDHITKSVVFIIDEFELFATHPRQTLLYNLFDIAQSRKAPIAVLGLTTRIDVAESLEKRVKSRFSHRYVHLANAKSFNAFQEACKAAITIDNDDLTETERNILGWSNNLTSSLEKVSKEHKSSALAYWNTFIDDLVSESSFTHFLHSLYYTTKSIPAFQSSMLLPMSTLDTSATTSTIALATHIDQALTTTTALQPPDSKLPLLSSLSTLHLALLICAARLTAIHNIDNVPFAQAYEEYKTLALKAKLQASSAGALAQGGAGRVWGKDVARGAWGELVGCGLVMEDGVRGCRIDVGLEEIGMSGVELRGWGRWCRQI